MADDPWVPARLDARIGVSSAEDEIRRAFWAVLSKWLVQTARRVLRGSGPPNLDGIWAQVPAWHTAVEHVVQGAIRRAMREGYVALFGSDYPWDQRVFVASYLGEVTNRMVRTADDAYDLVAGQVAEAVNLGEGIPQIRDRVDQVLSTTATERWPNRATVVARTEAIGALNAGRNDAFLAYAEDEPDEELEKMWLATSDPRTRATHREAEGQRVPLDQSFIVGGFPLMFPGDPSGPPQEVIQCRCTQLLVEVGESVDMSNRQFKKR